MSYLVLARKYRPQTFDAVIKQDHITRTLTNAISLGRVAHAILFSGPRGTGKTTVARILAKAMNCKEGPTPSPCNVCRSCSEITSGHAVDVFEIDGASNNSVDQVRDLRENLKYMPAHSTYKIYIIDEVHMLSIAAFNALLKTLEEPPAHIMFIFATTEPHKIPITILSRCQRHDFRRIDVESILRHMEQLCSKENTTIVEESLWLIAREAGGSMRDALSLLDQVMACAEGEITYSQTLDVLGVIDRKFIFDISEALILKNISRLLDILDGVYDRGHDIKKLYADLLEHFRNLLVVKMGKNISKLVDLSGYEIDRTQEQVKDVSVAFLKQVFDSLFKEEAAIRFSSQPKLALEMAFVRISQINPALPIDVLIDKLDVLRKEVSGIPSQNNERPVSALPADPKQKPQEIGSEISGVAETEEPYMSAVSAETAGYEKDGDLKKAWEGILKILDDTHPSLATNLTSSALTKLSDQHLEIEVNGNGFNINMVRRKKNMAILKKTVSEFFGKEMNIKVNAKVVQDDKSQAVRSEEAQLKQEALSHPLVADAIEIFNGKVVEIKTS